VRTGEEAPETVRTSKLPHPAQLAEGVNEDTLEEAFEDARQPRSRCSGDNSSLWEELRSNAARGVKRPVEFERMSAGANGGAVERS